MKNIDTLQLSMVETTVKKKNKFNDEGSLKTYKIHKLKKLQFMFTEVKNIQTQPHFYIMEKRKKQQQ